MACHVPRVSGQAITGNPRSRAFSRLHRMIFPVLVNLTKNRALGALALVVGRWVRAKHSEDSFGF